MADSKDLLPSYTSMHELAVFKISSENLIKMWVKSSFGFSANSSIQVDEKILEETLFLKQNVKTNTTWLGFCSEVLVAFFSRTEKQLKS